MLYEVDGKVYRKVKEQKHNSCKGCVADIEEDEEETTLCAAIKETYGNDVCYADDITGESGYIFEEVVEFKSHRELWEWLLAGNKVIKCDTIVPKLFFLCEDKLVYSIDDRVYTVCTPTLHHFSLYKPYIASIPAWYDNIPEQGILCWVSDYYKDKKDGIYIIKEYDPTKEKKFVAYRYEVAIADFKYATPLTKEEVLERCYDN